MIKNETPRANTSQAFSSDADRGLLPISSLMSSGATYCLQRCFQFFLRSSILTYFLRVYEKVELRLNAFGFGRSTENPKSANLKSVSEYINILSGLMSLWEM